MKKRMRTLEQYNDFVRRKCELSTRRDSPPKAPIQRPKFVRARREGEDRVVGEVLTDIPLVGHAQRLAAPTAQAPDGVKAMDQETQASVELPLEFSQNALTAMKKQGVREEDFREYINTGAIRQKFDIRHVDEVVRARDQALLARAEKQAESALLQRRINDGEIDLIALQSLHVPHVH